MTISLSLSSLYESERGEASPEFVPGREMDILDAGACSDGVPPTLTPVIGVASGVRSAGAVAAASTAASASARHESVFAGGTYELEHPVNHLGNDLRNDALVVDEDEDSRFQS